MWWHKVKIALVISLLVMLAGCSKVTIGKIDGEVRARISSVAVIDTTGRAGQLYNRALRRALYAQVEITPAYDLTSSISVSSSSALSVTGVASNFRKMTMVANFTLKRLHDNRILLTDAVTADATLGTVKSLFSQDQSESHARDRMAELLAQRVVHRLQLFFLKAQHDKNGQKQ